MKERMKRKPFLQPCCLVLAQKKSKYYSSISCLGTGKVEILQYYLTACRAFVTRLQTEKSKYHNTISRHAAPLVAIKKYKSRNLSLTKYFITTLLSKTFINILIDIVVYQTHVNIMFRLSVLNTPALSHISGCIHLVCLENAR